MFSCDFDEEVFQTLPGQGWRVLIQWNPDTPDALEGFPTHTLEPVIAWVTARVQREGKRHRYQDVVIAPLVRWPSRNELVLLDGNAPVNDSRHFVFLAPGEELSQQHFEQLRGEFSKGVTVQCA
jgi:hypothetical protein